MSYIFYDTKCGFCSKIIDAIRKRHILNNVGFYDISYIDELLTCKEKFILQGIDSIVVIDKAHIRIYSDAIIQLFILTGGIYKVIGFCIFLIPHRIRDVLYRFVARNRYRIFGSSECPALK
jgi:predicted DCC family thiol-disulfide oxidoreductase YuxK